MSDEEKKKSKLRELYVYRSKLSEKKDHLLKSRQSIDRELREVEDKLAGTEKGIARIENRRMLITTHAIERYHQRIDADATEDAIYAHIVTSHLVNIVQTLGNGTYPVDFFEVVVEDNKVITVQIPNQKRKPAHKSFVKPQRVRARKHR